MIGGFNANLTIERIEWNCVDFDVQSSIQAKKTLESLGSPKIWVSHGVSAPHPLGLPGPQNVCQPFVGQIVDTSTLVSDQLLRVSGNAGWYPIGIAKLVNITSMSPWFIVIVIIYGIISKLWLFNNFSY